MISSRRTFKTMEEFICACGIKHTVGPRPEIDQTAAYLLLELAANSHGERELNIMGRAYCYLLGSTVHDPGASTCNFETPEETMLIFDTVPKKTNEFPSSCG